MYCLNNRYYDAQTGRFISPDSVFISAVTRETAYFKNLYAYCDNDPVGRVDDNGEWWHIALGAIVGASIQYASDVVFNMASGKTVLESLKPTSSWFDYGAAALSGALVATGIGVAGSIMANASISVVNYLSNTIIIEKKEPKLTDTVVHTLIGGLAGAVGGKGVDGKSLRGVVKTSKTILKTAVSPRRISMYSAKIAACKVTVLKSTVRLAAAGMTVGIANYANKRLREYLQ